MYTKYVHVDGVAAHYFHAGASTLPDAVPDLSRGELAVLIHGEGGNGNVWHRQIAALAESHSPLAFDFPGHGRSGGTESLKSVSAYADFLHAFLTRLEARPCVLVGHSMGAAVALALAAAHPERVRALVLIACGARFDFPAALLDTWRNVMLGRAPQPFTMEPFSPKAEMPVIRETFTEQVKTDPRVRYHDMLACNDFDAIAAAKDIQVPALVVAGRDDQLVSLSTCEELAGALPKAQLAVIDDAGHTLPIERPDALNQALLRFLSEIA